jgi:hypothetical protein
MTLTLTPNEAEALYLAIACRLGLIETGVPMMRAVDAEAQGKKVKALSADQMKLILMLEDIMKRVQA